MQINFTPEKIKAAKAYVEKLQPVEVPQKELSKIKEHNGSFIKRLYKFLFH